MLQKNLEDKISGRRNTASAKTFFKKALRHYHEVPLIINTDQNRTYPCAIDELKQEGVLSQGLEHRRVKYLNNIIESDHRTIKRRIKPMTGFHSFKTANQALEGIKAMAMMIKQQTYFLTLARYKKIFKELKRLKL